MVRLTALVARSQGATLGVAMLAAACSQAGDDPLATDAPESSSSDTAGTIDAPSATLPGGQTSTPAPNVTAPTAPSAAVPPRPSATTSMSTGGMGQGGTPIVEPVPIGGGASVGGAGGLAGSDPGPSAAGAGTAGAAGAPTSGGSAVLDDLTTYLEQGPDERPALDGEPFASTPLTREQAERAKELLWDDYAARVRADHEAENEARSITIGDYTLRYAFTIFGDAPADGRSLFLSLHGGGEADAATNDGQWENQQVLYEPEEGVYLSPRAPTDTWNMWHQEHIDGLFTRLIGNMIVFEGVNPNRVYVMGYSAGGDGVYQLGPRMADSWAAAAMMAGHPNDAQPDSLRNIGFAVHVGELDADFDRNIIGAEWGEKLDALQAEDPAGYEHQVEVHAGKGHWMDLEDAVAVPWMAEFTRNPVPNRVIWLEDDAPHERFYWLRLSEADQVAGVLVEASYEGQTIVVEGEGLTADVEVMLDDSMLDLDEAVSVVTPDGEELYSGVVERTIGDLYSTLEERGDPALMFSSKVSVTP